VTKLDALVIGGGPGGVSAAYHLARGGAQVALIDSREPGGRRPAAGVLSVLAQDCLAGMDLGDWASRQKHCPRMRFVGPRGSVAAWTAESEQRTSLLVPRQELEPVLLDAAASVGVQLFLDLPVASLEAGNDGVRARTEGYNLPDAKLAILAEGARARLAKDLGLVRRGADYVNLHAMYEHAADGLCEMHYLHDLMPSVSWAVPVSHDTVCLSVSSLSRGVKGSVLMSSLKELAAERAFAGGLAGRRPLQSPRVRFIRSGLNSVTPYGERLLLAGEVAGVVHPLTLEGIGAAMESGRIAAQHACYALEKGRFTTADLSAYARALRRAFGVEYRAARFLRELLRSERVLERIVGRAQRDAGFANLVAGLFTRSQSTLGALTPANLLRYLMWWRGPGRRASGQLTPR